jgi:hypothetical protein
MQLRSCKSYTYDSPLERFLENIFDGAMLVLLANLCLMRIFVGGMYGMRMRVQLQYKRIRNHYSGKEQKQKDGDMAGKPMHFSWVRLQI